MSVRRSAWLIVFGLIPALLAPTQQSRAAEIDNYLPDDTQVILHANIRKILESELAKNYLLPQLEATIQGNAEIRQLMSAMGFGIKEVSSVTWGAPGESGKQWLLLVHAKFDLAKIRSTVEAFAAKQPEVIKFHKHQDVPYYETGNPKQPAQTFFAAFVDQDTFVLSPDKDYVLTAIGKKGSTKVPALDNKLMELVKKIDTKQSLWLALLPDRLAKALPQDKQTQDIVSKVQSFMAGIALTDGAQLSVRIQTSNAKSAQEIRKYLQGVQGLLIFMITSNDKLKDFRLTLTDIVNSIKFTLDQGTVGFDVSVSAKQIEEGFKK